MKRIFQISLLLLFSSSLTFAQHNLNSYKYIVVPHQFNFQKKSDSYQINALTKFLFEKEGFVAVFSDEKPEELIFNECLGLTVNELSNSSLFATKIAIELTNCKGEVVFKSMEGKSKEKEFKKAYHEAIRNAFNSVKTLNYKYNEKESIVKIRQPKRDVVFKKPVEKVVVEEVKEEPKKVVAKVEKEVVEEVKEQSKSKLKKIRKVKENAVKAVTILGNYKNSDLNFTIEKKEANYVLINKTVGVIANLYTTSKPHIYIVQWLSKEKPQLAVFNGYGKMSIDGENEIVNYNKVD